MNHSGGVDLDWLETFLAVVDRGGFTAASQRVHRSQSRVSAHIAALERDLGARLFDRSRRPTALTPAGEVLVRYARGVIDEVAAARSAVGAVRDLERNDLILVTTPAIGAALFPGVLARVTAELSDVRIQLAEQNESDTTHRLVADGAAMAVLPVVTAMLSEGLERRVLWQERLSVVVPRRHPLAAHRGPLQLELIAGEPLLVCRIGPHDEPVALRMLADHGMTVRPRVTVDSPHTLVELARAGVGVGIIDAVALHQLDLTDLVVRDIAEEPVVREVAAYWSDVLLRTESGRRLHRAVLEAPLPTGAQPPGTPSAPLNSCGVRNQVDRAAEG